MPHQAFTPPPTEAILDKLGPIIRQKVIIEDRTYLIDHPGAADQLQKHPAVREAFARDQYVPYWADLWPASRMLARAMLHEAWTPGTEALELGCGLGLAGIVGLSMGLSVAFTDYDPTALRFAADNARLNGLTNFRTLQLDWRQPPADLRVPVILAADLLYDGKVVVPLFECVRTILQPGGLWLLTDQDRIPSAMFRQRLEREGWPFSTKLMRAGEPGGLRVKGTLYRITRPQ